MPNVILRVLHGHRLRRIDHSRLARIIPRQPRPWPQPSRARDIHERSPLALLLHVRDNHFRRVVDTPAIHIKAHVEVLVRHIIGGLVAVGCAGIVDYDVAGSVRINGLLEQGFPVVEFGDICQVEGTVKVFGSCLAELGFEVCDDDFGALLDEFFCYGFAEALACEGMLAM